MDSALSTPSFDAVVLFDAKCPLCVRLAHWSQSRLGGALSFKSWQSYCEDPNSPFWTQSLCHGGQPEQLVVIQGSQLKTGADAWGYLLQAHPSLRELGWLARQLGLEHKAATYLGRTAGWLRSTWCRACPKPPLR